MSLFQPRTARYLLTISLVVASLAFAQTSQASGLPTVDGRYSGVGQLGTGGILHFAVLGRGGVPSSGVGAVALNVTVTNPSASSFLTVWPDGSPRPTASNLNFVAGETVPNMVIVPVGGNGQVSLYNNTGTTDVVVDVLGWFPTGPGFTGLQPARLLDTRLLYPDGCHLVQYRSAGTISIVDFGGASVSMFQTPSGTSNLQYAHFADDCTGVYLDVALPSGQTGIRLYGFDGSIRREIAVPFFAAVSAAGWQITAEGRFLGADGSKVIDLTTGATVFTAAAGDRPMVDPSGDYILTVGNTGVKVYDVDGQLLHSISNTDLADSGSSVSRFAAVSPGADMIAVTGDRSGVFNQSSALYIYSFASHQLMTVTQLGARYPLWLGNRAMTSPNYQGQFSTDRFGLLDPGTGAFEALAGFSQFAMPG